MEIVETRATVLRFVLDVTSGTFYPSQPAYYPMRQRSDQLYLSYTSICPARKWTCSSASASTLMTYFHDRCQEEKL